MHKAAGIPGARPPTRSIAMRPKNTICLWFDKDALDAATF